MRTIDQTTQEILDLATKHFNVPAGSLAPDDDFFKKLGIDIRLGAINTGVLIVSSFTMAMAVYTTQIGKRKGAILCLILTMILGATFLGIKAVEYHDKFTEHQKSDDRSSSSSDRRGGGEPPTTPDYVITDAA